jgi:hypothetical protein
MMGKEWPFSGILLHHFSMKPAFLRLCVLPVVLILAGCASTPSGEGYPVIVDTEVPLLEHGPGQTTPADGVVRAGTRARIVNDGSQYVYIETRDGRRGFVPRAALTVYDPMSPPTGPSGVPAGKLNW